MRTEIQEAITVLEKPLGVLVGMHTIMLKRQTAPTRAIKKQKTE